MTREDIREQTMQIIFQMDVTQEFDHEKLTPIEENIKVMEKKQSMQILDAVRDHIGDIDQLIKDNLDKWNFDRLGRTDLAILRTSVAEMLYCEDIPRSVSINEAVELAKKYGDERSYAFINSVLSKIDKSLGK